MKTTRLAGLVSAVLMGLRAAPVGAQQISVITPSDITVQGQHTVSFFSLSPSDETIAFTVRVPASSPSFNLYTTAHLANTSQQLTFFNGEAEAFSPAWNTFGLQIGYVAVAFNGNFLAVTPTGNITSANVFVDSNAPSWGLSQDLLTFRGSTRSGAFPWDIFTIASNGTGLKRIVDCSTAECGHPQWSPFENVIAYQRDNDIHLVNPDGSGDHIAITNTGDPNVPLVWSPQTGLMAFQCGTDVCVANEDGSGRVDLTNGYLGLQFSEPTWLADEGIIAVVGRQPLAVNGDLYVASTGSGLVGITLVQLTNTANASAPQFSPILPATTGTPPITSDPSTELFYICNRGQSDDLCLIKGLRAPPTGCDPTTCGGCCSGGICIPFPTTIQCGANGGACVTCSGGQVCSSLGICSAPSQCDIGNCFSGCCNSSGSCVKPSALACGEKGEPCKRCGPGEICDGTTHICVTNPCNAATCPNGCCTVDGVCKGGTTNDFCGLPEGGNCESCNSLQTCTNRQCVTKQCDYSNCATGCCDGSGNCVVGYLDNSCGAGGSTCMDCSALGEKCDTSSYSCGAPQTCTIDNCSTGCCDSGGCHGSSMSFCGLYGAPCAQCLSGQQCVNGWCQ